MKIYNKIFPVFLAVIFFTSCKTDEVNFLLDDSHLNLKVTDIVKVLNEEKMNISEKTVIIPYFKYTWSSTDENVAYIEDNIIKAVGVGNATITFKDEKGETLKSVDITVSPTYEFSAVSGETLYFSSVIPDYDPKEAIVSEYNPKFMNVWNKQYIQAAIPSVTNFIGLTTINGIRSWSVFTILPYEGETPFIMPDVVSSMNIEEVKEVMEGYNLKEEGDSYIGYSPYGKYLVYSPYGNSKDIKFNFKPERYDQPPYHIYNFVINPNVTYEQVLGYLFTNYEYGWSLETDGVTVSNIFNFKGTNYEPYFKIGDEWKVFSNPNDFDNKWSSLVFATTYINTTGVY